MKLKIFPIFFILFLIFLAFPAAAGIVPCGSGNGIENACTLCHLILGIKNLVSFGLTLLITAAAVGIFISGMMYVMSAGSEQAITKAKEFLGASLKGFTIVLAGWFLVAVTMWIISADEKLGIERVRWDLAPGGIVEYKCSTISKGGQGNPKTPNPNSETPPPPPPPPPPQPQKTYTCKCADRTWYFSFIEKGGEQKYSSESDDSACLARCRDQIKTDWYSFEVEGSNKISWKRTK